MWVGVWSRETSSQTDTQEARQGRRKSKQRRSETYRDLRKSILCDRLLSHHSLRLPPHLLSVSFVSLVQEQLDAAFALLAEVVERVGRDGLSHGHERSCGCSGRGESS